LLRGKGRARRPCPRQIDSGTATPSLTTMVWTTFTPEQLTVVSRWLFMPFILLITYTLMIYLVVFY
jgi:hypothetical protein